MSLNDDTLRMVRRNMLLGIWAAKELGLVGESAEAYSRDLAMGTLDFGRSDVLSKIRRDFGAAGVVHSDEEIRAVMEKFWLQAAGQSKRGDARDSAIIQIARNLISR
ncbi:ATPase inhibitor subunit zeta [Mesorhizobium sp. BAC0120]|uniref:ATPase inhibitor subunit zeta n=1 Tax=Mesorhizobium sp. BAC0120 TaxID=3090670 RepID=UPI00298D34C4|nr:ATPase inhibitor subunit zeta [Mesorhizobium sp. BAC0120]MDW6023121.1 ATPase inhibitor subunit zeta [Mesorhizobium sp. BAC0120]